MTINCEFSLPGLTFDTGAKSATNRGIHRPGLLATPIHNHCFRTAHARNQNWISKPEGGKGHRRICLLPQWLINESKKFNYELDVVESSAYGLISGSPSTSDLN